MCEYARRIFCVRYAVLILLTLSASWSPRLSQSTVSTMLVNASSADLGETIGCALFAPRDSRFERLSVLFPFTIHFDTLSRTMHLATGYGFQPGCTESPAAGAPSSDAAGSILRIDVMLATLLVALSICVCPVEGSGQHMSGNSRRRKHMRMRMSVSYLSVAVLCLCILSAPLLPASASTRPMDPTRGPTTVESTVSSTGMQSGATASSTPSDSAASTTNASPGTMFTNTATGTAPEYTGATSTVSANTTSVNGTTSASSPSTKILFSSEFFVSAASTDTVGVEVDIFLPAQWFEMNPSFVFEVDGYAHADTVVEVVDAYLNVDDSLQYFRSCKAHNGNCVEVCVASGQSDALNDQCGCLDSSMSLPTPATGETVSLFSVLNNEIGVTLSINDSCTRQLAGDSMELVEPSELSEPSGTILDAFDGYARSCMAIDCGSHGRCFDGLSPVYSALLSKTVFLNGTANQTSSTGAPFFFCRCDPGWSGAQCDEPLHATGDDRTLSLARIDVPSIDDTLARTELIELYDEDDENATNARMTTRLRAPGHSQRTTVLSRVLLDVELPQSSAAVRDTDLTVCLHVSNSLHPGWLARLPMCDRPAGVLTVTTLDLQTTCSVEEMSACAILDEHQCGQWLTAFKCLSQTCGSDSAAVRMLARSCTTHPCNEHCASLVASEYVAQELFHPLPVPWLLAPPHSPDVCIARAEISDSTLTWECMPASCVDWTQQAMVCAKVPSSQPGGSFALVNSAFATLDDSYVEKAVDEAAEPGSALLIVAFVVVGFIAVLCVMIVPVLLRAIDRRRQTFGVQPKKRRQARCCMCCADVRSTTFVFYGIVLAIFVMLIAVLLSSDRRGIAPTALGAWTAAALTTTLIALALLRQASLRWRRTVDAALNEIREHEQQCSVLQTSYASLNADELAHLGVSRSDNGSESVGGDTTQSRASHYSSFGGTSSIDSTTALLAHEQFRRRLPAHLRAECARCSDDYVFDEKLVAHSHVWTLLLGGASCAVLSVMLIVCVFVFLLGGEPLSAPGLGFPSYVIDEEDACSQCAYPEPFDTPCSDVALPYADFCRGCIALCCSDGVQNGAEYDVDCGGFCGSDCPASLAVLSMVAIWAATILSVLFVTYAAMRACFLIRTVNRGHLPLRRKSERAPPRELLDMRRRSRRTTSRANSGVHGNVHKSGTGTPRKRQHSRISRKSRRRTYAEPPAETHRSGVDTTRHSAVQKNTDADDGDANAAANPVFDDNVNLDEVLMHEAIGVGAFGRVHRATWRGQTVAVKLLLAQPSKSQQRRAERAFAKECRLFKQLPPHRNVIAVMGASTKPAALIMELCTLGSLDHFVRKHALTHRQQLVMALDIIGALRHLHEHGIVHRDLAARNLLIDAERVIKMTDFGLARVIATEGYVTEYQQGAIRWMAPECMEERRFSTRSDVWAFGVVLWELATGQLPYPLMTPMQAGLFVVQRDARLPKPKERCPERYYTDVMMRCWAREPRERATTRELAETLRSMLVEFERTQVNTMSSLGTAVTSTTAILNAGSTDGGTSNMGGSAFLGELIGAEAENPFQVEDESSEDPYASQFTSLNN